MFGPSEGALPGEVRCLGNYVFLETGNLSKHSAIADVFPARRLREKKFLLVLRTGKPGQEEFMREEIEIRQKLSSDAYLREHMPLIEAFGNHAGYPCILVQRILDEDLIPVLEVKNNLPSLKKFEVSGQILKIVEHWHNNGYLVNDIGNNNPTEDTPIFKADRYILLNEAGILRVMDLDANLAKKIHPFKEVVFTDKEKKQLAEYHRDIDSIKYLNSTNGRKKISELCQQINSATLTSEGASLEKLRTNLIEIGDTMLHNGIYPDLVINKTQDLWYIDGLSGDASLQLDVIFRLIKSIDENRFPEVFAQVKKSRTNWQEFNPIFKENEIVDFIQSKINSLRSNLYSKYFSGRDFSSPKFGIKVWHHTIEEINLLTAAADNELMRIDEIPQEVMSQNADRNIAILNEYQCILTIIENLLGKDFIKQIRDIRKDLNSLQITKDVHSKAAALIRDRLKLSN